MARVPRITAAGAEALGSAQMAMVAGPLHQQRSAVGAQHWAVGSLAKPGPRRGEDSALSQGYFRGLNSAIGSVVLLAWHST